MPINHEKVAAMDNKFGIADLNADHKITNMLGYELVEEKNLPAGTTTCTFANLDGNTDEEYLLESYLNIVDGGGTGVIQLLPNNVATNQFENMYYIKDSDALNTWRESVINLTSTMNDENAFSYSMFKIFAKSGNPRIFIIERVIKSTTHFMNQSVKGYWDDTTSNLTSIVIKTDLTSTFSGKIRLWKRIPLE